MFFEKMGHIKEKEKMKGCDYMKSFSIIREGAFDRYEKRELGLVNWLLRDMVAPLERRKKEKLTVSERHVRILLHDILTEIEKTAKEREVDLHSVSYGMMGEPR